MTEAASEAASVEAKGVSPYAWFGISALVAAGWAMYQMLAWASVPSFGDAAWPTTLGILIALAVFFVVGLRAPPND